MHSFTLNEPIHSRGDKVFVIWQKDLYSNYEVVPGIVLGKNERSSNGGFNVQVKGVSHSYFPQGIFFTKDAATVALYMRLKKI